MPDRVQQIKIGAGSLIVAAEMAQSPTGSPSVRCYLGPITTTDPKVAAIGLAMLVQELRKQHGVESRWLLDEMRRILDGDASLVEPAPSLIVVPS